MKNALHQKGAILIEAMVSLVLMLIGVVTYMTLIQNATQWNAYNYFRLEAIKIAEKQIAALSVYNQANLADYVQSVPQVVSSLPNGSLKIVLKDRGSVSVTVSWTSKSTNSDRHVTMQSVISDVYSN